MLLYGARGRDTGYPPQDADGMTVHAGWMNMANIC